MTGPASRIAALAGFARSIAMYRLNPLKRRRQIAFYRQFAGPGDLCFDVGAHLGDRVSAFRALGARVVALEPQPAFARALRVLYGRDPGVVLLAQAAGPESGTAVLHVNRRAPTLSTLSADWAARVARAPSFRGQRWEEAVTVPVTTLDALVARHGVPAFCKIDVEGFEAAVLDGLSAPIPCLSFEFVPATMGGALACLDRLARLGRWEFQVVFGESFRFALPGWTGAEELAARLAGLPADAGSGDVYARLLTAG
ncbi:FkbM family methyltransferase [Arenibaculum sp.]|uniref:FkbM family methyltransferase n=1 Tax=Arenibaculum sp. TaxID=2865862 RepID=UPI002E0D8DD4|nr:FkbM family methyltransferase [Arenibaculum sp.]